MSVSVVLVLISVATTTLLCALAWRRPSRHAAVAQCVTPEAPAERGWMSIADLDDDLIQTVLELHYRQVLADPNAQKVWRKLLREASAVRTVRNIGR